MNLSEIPVSQKCLGLVLYLNGIVPDSIIISMSDLYDKKFKGTYAEVEKIMEIWLKAQKHTTSCADFAIRITSTFVLKNLERSADGQTKCKRAFGIRWLIRLLASTNWNLSPLKDHYPILKRDKDINVLDNFILANVSREGCITCVPYLLERSKITLSQAKDLIEESCDYTNALTASALLAWITNDKEIIDWSVSLVDTFADRGSEALLILLDIVDKHLPKYKEELFEKLLNMFLERVLSEQIDPSSIMHSFVSMFATKRNYRQYAKLTYKMNKVIHKMLEMEPYVKFDAYALRLLLHTFYSYEDAVHLLLKAIARGTCRNASGEMLEIVSEYKGYAHVLCKDKNLILNVLRHCEDGIFKHATIARLCSEGALDFDDLINICSGTSGRCNGISEVLSALFCDIFNSKLPHSITERLKKLTTV